MKKVAILAVLAAALPLSAWAECSYPKKPGKPPNGNKAPRAEMIAAKKVVDQYQTDVNEYLKCLKTEHETALAASTAAEPEKKKMTERWEKKNDAAVDEAQSIADRFNEQLRLCQQREDKCKK
jgi:hypothetical protein